MISKVQVLLRLKPLRKYTSVMSSLYCTSGESKTEVLRKEQYYLKSKIKEEKPPETEETSAPPPVESEPVEKRHNFPSLLRNSAFIDLGNPEDKIVVGEVFLIVDTDLYIDFGWKFHTVCSVEPTELEKYQIGSQVRLRIRDLELCSKFLGSDYYISLLESDCDLLGLYKKSKVDGKSVEKPKTPHISVVKSLPRKANDSEERKARK